MDALVSHLPPEFFGFVLTLGLSLLIGFEREEHEPEGIGGVRTFPIIGLGGFLLIAGFPDTAIPFALGLVVMGGLVALTHWHALQLGEPGITTEAAALLTFTIGGCAAKGLYWISIATGVVTVILLHEKRLLEGLATALPRHEMRTLLRFLLLIAVILPVVPNRTFTPFEINPFKLWLVVVAVSGVSYVSYLLRMWWGEDRGLILAGLLGGAYSSTVTTVVLSRQSKKREPCSVGYAGAIVAATGMMYIRLWILLLLFAAPLAYRLTGLFWGLSVAAVIVGSLLARTKRVPDDCEFDPTTERRDGNPLDVTSAFTFAAIFLAILVATKVVAERFGTTGVLVMAAIMGAADVDPFILGLTQNIGSGLDLGIAALAVVIASAVNNLMKGVYAVIFGSRRTGRLSLALLASFGAISVVLFLVF
ncbi:MAG: MgtC/SapB family protein [Acidobacteria bacterium]|uniref:MgtC/SapB family protein n=1 Tax=Candidatus Sulfomarinibacter kjeldsenii TaxID=2885994 RepID=A0A8J7C3M1_9BACT|nr:MgtC/SapB family protein [Candidatus Sulfomarinibacter kjeldsenii]